MTIIRISLTLLLTSILVYAWSQSNVANDNNLIRNGGFELWESNTPLCWRTNNVNGDLRAIDEKQDGTKNSMIYLNLNSEGAHFIQQKVFVEKDLMYTFQVRVTGSIFNYYYGGIQALSSNETLVGQHLFTMSNLGSEWKTLKTKFRVQRSDTITLRIGFMYGAHTSLYFDEAVLKIDEMKTDYSPCIQAFLAKCNVVGSINENNFDTSIEQICNYINYSLMGDFSGEELTKIRMGNKSEIPSKQLKKIVINDSKKKEIVLEIDSCFNSRFFHEYLNKPTVIIGEAYCQKSSLSCSEILERLGITTRQVHWSAKGIGFHQFFEYYNPYTEKWIILDPDYGVKYKLNGSFVGSNDLLNVIGKSGFKSRYIKKMSIKKYIYSKEQIVDGWKSDVQVLLIYDNIISLP